MHYIFFLLILCGLYELVVGVKQFLIDVLNDCSSYTVYGTFSNPAPFAMLIGIILPIAWLYTLHWKIILVSKGNLFFRIEVVFSCCYVIMSLVALPLSMSRTSWIAAILACSVVTYIHLRENSVQKFHWNVFEKKLNIIALIVFSFICISGIYFLKKESADGRLLIWKISSSIVKEHAVYGVGKGYFPGAYGRAQEEYFRKNKGTEHEKTIAGAPEYAYNEYLQIIIEHGIIGLLFLMLIIGYCFYHLLHTSSRNRIPIMGAFVSLLIMAFFSYPLRNIYTCLLSISIIVLIILLPTGRKTVKSRIVSYVMIVLMLFAIFYKECFSFRNLGNMKIAYKQWNLLKPYFDSELFDEITENYAILYPYLKSDAAFLFEYGQCLSKTRKYEQSNLILQEGLCRSSDPMFLNILGKNYQRLERYQLAEKMFYKAYYRIPHKIYPLYLLMLLYEEQRKEEHMLSMAYRIVNQKVKINSPETQYVKARAKKILEQYQNKKKRDD